ncbi:MAG: hypothetical protein K0R83_1947, partial [Caulobacter sp.]|nr:hypothetical protein [Caulobacter sp.]
MAGFKVARSGFFLGREAGGNFLASVGDAVTKAIGPQTVARFESNLSGAMIITTAVDPV